MVEPLIMVILQVWFINGRLRFQEVTGMRGPIVFMLTMVNITLHWLR